MAEHSYKRHVRVARKTLLVVGEGYAEVAFLKHIRNLYTCGGAGCSMAIANARGKGAQHVIAYTIRTARTTAHDQVATLLDSDTDWNEKVEALARTKKISVLLSQPCLEAPLLHIYGAASEQSTAEHKKDFRGRFGGDAHDERLLEKCFPKEVLDDARGRVPVLAQLLTLLGI